MWTVIGVILGLLLLLFVVVRVTKLINGKKYAINTPNGMDEELYIPVNGQEQYLLIKGEDVKNPLILHLHGGPGGPDGMAAYWFTKDLVDSFTVVCWDQRGCGNTYYHNNDKDNATVTWEQALADVDAVVDYLRERFGQEKIYLLGHSYGTLLGSAYALRYPEKVAHYVSVSQVVNIKDAETRSYIKARKIAEEQGKDTTKMVAAYDTFMKESTIINNGKLRRLTVPYHKIPRAKNTISVGVVSPYMTWKALKWQLLMMFRMKEGIRLNQKLIDYILEVNLMEEEGAYQVPVLFVEGECDPVCPVDCVKEYMDKITAPQKEIVVFEGCGHSPNYDDPEEFAKLMKGLLES